jgi:hypothetical protein
VIKWMSATELVVAIPAEAQAHLDLQVVKFADIQIKLEVLPSNISSSVLYPRLALADDAQC